MRSFLTACFFLIYLLDNQAQTKADLEHKRKDLQNKIQTTQAAIQKNNQTRQQALNQLEQIRQQLKTHQKNLKFIHSEVETIEQIINRKASSVKMLQTDVDSFQTRQRALARLMYLNQIRQPQTAAPSPLYYQHTSQQAILKYQVGQKLGGLLLVLEIFKNQLSKRVALLSQEYQNKAQALAEVKEAHTDLTTAAAKKDKLAQDLAAKTQKLRQQLAQSEKAKQSLNQKIESTILAQISSAKTQARTAQPTVNPTVNAASKPNPVSPLPELPKTNNMAEINRLFLAQKGKMPAPAKGSLIARFGTQPHAELPMVMVNNNGVDIKTSPNASVQAVFAGQVVSVFTIPSMGNALMIKHGDYYTTYSNLGTITVKRGAWVQAGQSIGAVGKEPNSGAYVLHFELWKNKLKENPSLWVRL